MQRHRMDRHVCPLQPACGLSAQPVGHSRHERDHFLLVFHRTTTQVGACFSAAPFNLRAILPRSQTGTVEADVLLPTPHPQQVERFTQPERHRMDRHACPLQPACDLSVRLVGHSRHGRDHSPLWSTGQLPMLHLAAALRLIARVARVPSSSQQERKSRPQRTSLNACVHSWTPSCTTLYDVIIRFIRFLLLQRVQQRPPLRRHCQCYLAHEVFALQLLAFKTPTLSSSEAADRSLAVTQAPALWMLASDIPDKSKKAGGPQEKNKRKQIYIYIYTYVCTYVCMYVCIYISSIESVLIWVEIISTQMSTL